MIRLETLQSLFTFDASSGAFFYAKGSPKAGERADKMLKSGYRCVYIFGMAHLAHRIAWQMGTGKAPAQLIDHINGNKQDNRLCNLRECTHLQNAHNRHKTRSDNRSGRTGVRRANGKWTAFIYVDGPMIRLGTFSTFEEAVKAREDAERKHHPFSPAARGHSTLKNSNAGVMALTPHHAPARPQRYVYEGIFA